MDLRRILWPFPSLTRLGWATVRVPNPAPGHERGYAFFLRGNGVIFSHGLTSLCGEMRTAGWWAEDLLCYGDLWACRYLIAKKEAGRLRGPIIFVGHSCGGRSTVRAARQLESAGITVDLLLCIDAAFPPAVPGNVRRAIHLYLPGPRIYPARPLVAAPSSEAVIRNIALNSPGSPIPSARLHHLNVANHPAVLAFVRVAILEVSDSTKP